MSRRRPTKPSNQRNRRGNGRPRSKSRSNGDEEQLDSRGRDNDPNWYFTSSELATQSAQLSFQEFIGGGPVLDHANVPALAVVRLNACPGITSTPWKNGPTFNFETINVTRLPTGASLNRRDGMNLMNTKLYTLLSSKSGRTMNYAPQDVGIMILALSSIVEVVECIRRAFGVALTYNPRNREVPKCLLNAYFSSGDAGIQDFFANMSDYRMRFNTQIQRINQLPILDNIGFLRKSREIYQRVYLDDNSSMAQMFMYMPTTAWILDEQSYDIGTVLRDVTVPGFETAGNMGMWIDMLSHQIDEILESTTLNLIYADLWNLASKISVPMTTFDYLSEDYIVMPELNRNALLQFHNLTVVGRPRTLDTPTKTVNNNKFTSSNWVWADPDLNVLQYNPMFALMPAHDIIVDMDTPDPSLEDRIEALRFSVVRSNWLLKDGDGPNDLWGVYYTLPDHYAVDIEFIKSDSDLENNRPAAIGSSDFAVVTWETGRLANRVSPYCWELEQFSWHPIEYGWTYHYDDEQLIWLSDIGSDLNYFTTVDWLYMMRLNRMISTGLFEFRV